MNGKKKTSTISHEYKVINGVKNIVNFVSDFKQLFTKGLELQRIIKHYLKPFNKFRGG
ncbi:hypothetical protein GCM10008986_08670 [Salinibacillus aidingensis]|uniref:Transposase n=1 Tax=Salinibacillus aidingensis TaxID=237684 RepID=A0ABN1AX33_9BACI